MATQLPTSITGAFWAMVIGYIITLGYSIYMAILNYKQAKVKDILERTNKLLEAQNQILGRIEEKK